MAQTAVGRSLRSGRWRPPLHSWPIDAPSLCVFHDPSMPTHGTWKTQDNLLPVLLLLLQSPTGRARNQADSTVAGSLELLSSCPASLTLPSSVTRSRPQDNYLVLYCTTHDFAIVVS